MKDLVDFMNAKCLDEEGEITARYLSQNRQGEVEDFEDEEFALEGSFIVDELNEETYDEWGDEKLLDADADKFLEGDFNVRLSIALEG